jgi:spermidine synthase
MKNIQLSTLFFIIINVTTSLTSLYLFMLVTREVSILSGQETIVQGAYLGLYLLALGLGTMFLNQKVLSSEEKISRLAKMEIGVILCGTLSFYIIYLVLLMRVSIGHSPYVAPNDLPILSLFASGAIGVFAIGLFTGGQLPLLLSYSSIAKKSSILFLNYFGALLAGPLLNHLVHNEYELLALIIMGLLMSLITLALMALLIKSYRLSFAILAPCLLILCLMLSLVPTKRSFLAAYYHGLKAQNLREALGLYKILPQVGDIEVIITPYQEINLVKENPVLGGGFSGNFSLHLNYRPQFDVISYKNYHESIVYGAKNLSVNDPKNILIIGGGDGIALDLIKKVFVDANIKMVEIDERIIEISKRHPIISRLNNYVFHDTNTIQIDDGFNYLRNSDSYYDAIFIDFPFPFSDELKKLFSYEFFTFVRRRLSPLGFAILDFPIVDHQEVEALPLAIRLRKTVSLAGFETVFPFGPYSSFFYLEKNKREISFDYSLLDKEEISLSTRMNFFSLDHLFLSEPNNTRPLSLFYGY